MYNLTLTTILFIFFISSAYAYIGPGVGGGAIAAAFGLIVAVFAVLFGLIWFPVKRFLKKRKEKKDQQKNKVD